jgi:predicted nucleic acid-binding protein
MKALIDTNVILDALMEREPFNTAAENIIILSAEGKISACITASSVTDIYYIIRKTFNDTDSREKIRTILKYFLQAIEVTKDDCFTALDSTLADFEDALVAVCADKEDIDFIVTRDIQFLKLEKAISPNDFLKKFKGA